MADYKVNFKQLKNSVGIDDVAYSLGYRLDRKAGVGRYIELVLGDGKNRRDTIIVTNTRNKASQVFFRRNGDKGDVITLIKENLNSFFVSGKDDWEKVAKVMARFANMPEPEYRNDRDYVGSALPSRNFEADRYEIRNISGDTLPKVLSDRGFTLDTIRVFSDHIRLIRDKRNGNFDGYNIGFTYTTSDEGKPAGYEIRGLSGYKSKASGTNSSSAAWVANISGARSDMVESVYFFESAFDALAFHQLNKARLPERIALVSLGGTFSDNQVRNVIQRFPNARSFDCFDNDISGRSYSLRLMAIVEDMPMKITKTDSFLLVETKGKSIEVKSDKSVSSQILDKVPIKRKLGHWTPPKNFKDWNDCLLNKPMELKVTPVKSDRDRNLSERRNSSLKL